MVLMKWQTETLHHTIRVLLGAADPVVKETASEVQFSFTVLMCCIEFDCVIRLMYFLHSYPNFPYRESRPGCHFKCTSDLVLLILKCRELWVISYTVLAFSNTT